MKRIITIKNLYIFIFLLSLFSILSALYIEYVLGAIPASYVYIKGYPIYLQYL